MTWPHEDAGATDSDANGEDDPYGDEDDLYGEYGDEGEGVDDPSDTHASDLDAAAASGEVSIPGDAAEDVLPGSLAADLAAYSVDITTGEISDVAMVDAPVQPGLAAQLSGSMPILLMAKSYQQSSHMPEVARVATRVTNGQIGVGIVVRLPPYTPAAAGAFLTRFSGSPIRLADPDIFLAPAHGGPDRAISSRTAGWHPWLANAPAPSAATDSGWITNVLERQNDAGATVLLSATGWVGSANGAKELGFARRWVTASRTVAGTTPMFVNLTMDRSWLTNTSLRALLLQEIVESTERLWYLRFRWPVVATRYGQLRDPALLDGYKELAVTAALENKVLVLPNSGLTGWIATALGATGFSTGMSWAEQAYADPRIMGSAKDRPKPPPTLRLFERTLLHTVDHASHVAILNESKYLLCQCRYCQALAAHTPSQALWNKETAALHYLLRVARLTAMLGASNRRMEALREVRRALQFLRTTAGSPSAPTGNNAPAHLSEWQRLLL